MAVSDPVADFLTCVRNAIRAKHRKVDVNASRMKTELAKVLLREHYINNFKVIEGQNQGVLRVYLKYSGDESSVVTGIRRISTPGRRVYVRKDTIPRVMGGLVPQLNPEAGSGVLFLVYTAGLMFVIRMWGSAVSHRALD